MKDQWGETPEQRQDRIGKRDLAWFVYSEGHARDGVPCEPRDRLHFEDGYAAGRADYLPNPDATVEPPLSIRRRPMYEHTRHRHREHIRQRGNMRQLRENRDRALQRAAFGEDFVCTWGRTPIDGFVAAAREAMAAVTPAPFMDSDGRVFASAPLKDPPPPLAQSHIHVDPETLTADGRTFARALAECAEGRHTFPLLRIHGTACFVCGTQP